MENIDDIMDFIKRNRHKIIGGQMIPIGMNRDFVAGKTMPLTKDQLKEFKEVLMQEKLARDAGKKHEAMHEAFWSKIKLGLGNYNTMRINEDTSELEIEADEDDKRKPIKSPIQKL